MFAQLDFRYLDLGQGSACKVFCQLAGPSLQFFFWARDFPLPNHQQHLSRRAQRWTRLLEAAGWDPAALQAGLGNSEEAVRRQLRRTGPLEQQPLGLLTSEQTVRADILLGLLASPRRPTED